MSETPNSAPPAEPMNFFKAAAICVVLVAALAVGFEGLKTVWRSPLTWEIYQLAGLAFLYLVPSVIAFRRAHHNRQAIVALNVLGGWTVVGWIVSLVWALARKPSS